MQVTGADSLHQRRAVLSLIGNGDQTTLYSFLIRFPKDFAATSRFQPLAECGAQGGIDSLRSGLRPGPAGRPSPLRSVEPAAGSSSRLIFAPHPAAG